MLARMLAQLSTDSVEPGQRLAYWTDMVCNTYVQLDCDVNAGANSIDGRIVASQVSSLQLSCVESTPQIVCRTPARIARDSEDYFLVSIQTRGAGQVAQDGRIATLSQGDFALYDSTRPYQLRFDTAFRQLVLRLPGPTLRAALPDADSLTARKVSGHHGAGHLMITMIHTLADHIDSLAPPCASAVAESVTQILIAGLSSLPAARSAPVTRLTGYHRERIKACVHARISDPRLSIATIAQHLKLSISSLHRAWAGESMSLSEWIWARRLDGARRDLANPDLGMRSVSDIAFAWGFSDAAHFSRAFRARFGCSPREWRQTSQQ